MNLRFTLRQLQYFVAAAEALNISAASRRVNVAQTAVASAIAKLEDQLGVDLVVARHAQGISLTAAGEHLLVEARTLLKDAEGFQKKALSFSSNLAGELRIGSYSSLTPSYLPSLIYGFTQLYPAVSVQVVEAEQDQLVARLRSGNLEIALIYVIDLPADIDSVHLDEAHAYALLPREHPLARKKSVSLQEIAKGPCILLETALAKRYYLNLFQEAGLAANVALYAPSVEALRGMVGWGLGISILVTKPTEDVAYDAHSIVYRPISDPIKPKVVGLAALKGLRQTKSGEAFLSFAAEYIANGGRDAPVLNPAVGA